MKTQLELALSTHVDDLKGAGRDQVIRRMLEILTKEFGTLKVKYYKFEHTGVMHEQDEKSFEVRTHQDHYSVKLRPIAADSVQHLGDDAAVGEELQTQYWSLLGGVAWMGVVRAPTWPSTSSTYSDTHMIRGLGTSRISTS